jgi:hypothetical protein
VVYSIRRLGTPQDVADAVRFLADDANSDLITGVVLDVASGAVLAQKASRSGLGSRSALLVAIVRVLLHPGRIGENSSDAMRLAEPRDEDLVVLFE